MPSTKLLIPEIKWPPETFLLNKINGLLKRGYQTTIGIASSKKNKPVESTDVEKVFLPRWDDPFLKRVFQLIDQLICYCLTEKKAFQRLSYLSKCAQQKPLRQRLNFLLRSILLSKVHPDLVLFEWNSSAIDCQYLLPLWQCGNVISCRGSQIYVRPFLPANNEYVENLKKSLINASAIHCVSEAMKQQVIQLGAPPEKIRVIRPAVDPDIFSSRILDLELRSPLQVISVGNLSWVKGYEYSLLAIKQVIDRGIDLRYKIIGDGIDYQHLLYTIYDLGLENIVELSGNLPHGSVVEALHRADVLVLSSLSEGISNAVLEAMSCGLPIVTTDCGGMREAVSDRDEGFVVPVRDPGAMADALIKLAVDPSLRQSMGRAGRQRVIKDFKLSDQVSAFIRLFDQIVGFNSIQGKND